MMRWLLLLCLLLPAPAHAGDDLDVKTWLSRPGVKLLAVEFYATWCKPCMEAVPRWKRLHEEYRDRGFRLVVVSVQDPDGTCMNPGWNPDDIVCDDEGHLSEAMKVGNNLPAAFLWSWRGNLLVRRGHVEDVARAVEAELSRLPRVTLDEDMDAELRPMLRAEMSQVGKVTVLADKAEREALAKIRRESHELGFSDRTTCKVGEQLAANSLLKATRSRSGGRERLTLQLFSAETGCLNGTASVGWNPSRPEGSVAEAVAELTDSLRSPVEVPSATSAKRKVFEGTIVGGSGEEWTPEDDTGELGIVEFVSTPPGATLVVDGEHRGNTPRTVSLRVGPHTVEMSLVEYMTQSGRVVVKDGQQITWPLAPDFGVLNIRTPTSGIKVAIDGAVAGATPVLQRRLNAGPHQVGVDDACYYPMVEQFTIERGETKDLVLELRARPAGLNVTARDVEGNDLAADVMVDDKPLGKAFKTHKVNICNQKLTVKAHGYGDWTLDLAGIVLGERATAKVVAVLSRGATRGGSRDIEIPQGNKSEEAADWQAEGSGDLAIVSFVSTPSGAQVQVDERTICAATPCRKAVVKGRHRVKMLLERHVVKEETLEANPGGEVRWSLEADFGHLSLETTPAGLAVEIDGNTAGTTPLSGVELSAGAHKLVISGPCHYAHTEQVVINRSEKKALRISPKIRPAGIQLTVTDPAGQAIHADVFIDGVKQEKQAPGTFMASVCAKLLEVKAGEQGSASNELTLTEKTTAKIDLVIGQDVVSGAAGGPEGASACDAYMWCCLAYASALGKVQGVPESAVQATKDGCKQVAQFESMGAGAQQACGQALDSMRQAGEAYKSMPGFIWPEECK